MSDHTGSGKDASLSAPPAHVGCQSCGRLWEELRQTRARLAALEAQAVMEERRQSITGESEG